VALYIFVAVQYTVYKNKFSRDQWGWTQDSLVADLESNTHIW